MDASHNLLVSDISAASSTGWESVTTGVTADQSGYIDAIVGSAKGGFCATSDTGSSVSYWCDRGYLYISRFLTIGNMWSSSGNSGIFNAEFSYYSDQVSNNLSSRLSYSTSKI